MSENLPRVGETAFWIAGIRAEETRRGDRALLSDPYASILLTGGEKYYAEFRKCGGIFGRIIFFLLQFVIFPAWALVSDTLSFRPQRAILTILSNYWRSIFASPWDFTYNEHVRRTIFIDETVLRECKGGTKQVVTLGAGLDTRSLRLPLASDVLCVEVDHPSVFAHKEPLLSSALDSGDAPAASRARRVPLPTAYAETFRFAADPRLASARDSPSGASFSTRRTVYVLEGLVMYLTDAQQESLFQEVGKAAAKGSVVVGDTYLFPGGKGAKAGGMDLNSLPNARLRSLLKREGFALRRLVASTADSIAFGTERLPTWGDYEQFPAQRYFFEAVKL